MSDYAYSQHGTAHKPRGSDPSLCDVWRYVGDDPEVPFITGFNMAATADIPSPVPMRFRLSVGPPNVCTYTGWYGTAPVGAMNSAGAPMVWWGDPSCNGLGQSWIRLELHVP